jgi:hypothetical protein
MRNLLFSVLLICSVKAQSQVYTAGTMLPGYHDINPDTLMTYQVVPYTHNIYAINIFGSPAHDIEFIAHGAVSSGGSAAYISVTSLNPNVYISFGRWDSVLVLADSTWNVTKVAKPLSAGNIVNAAGAVWDSTTLYLTDHSGSGGGNKDVNDWIGGDKYLGLKFQNGSSTDYGWLRVECISEDSCYVKDYSFSTTSTGIIENKRNALLLYPNPVAGVLYVRGLNSYPGLRITDILGTEVLFSSEITGDITEITLDPTLPQGCYLLQSVSGGQTVSRKLIKISR